MIKKRINILIFPLIFVLAGCPIFGDSDHNFVYKGTISANDTLLKDSILIRFENLGNIIFRNRNKVFSEKSAIDSNGNYAVSGHFFAAGGSDENIFDDSDSLSFEVIRNGRVIKTGVFCINNLNRRYTDSARFTTITLPAIQLK